ncbi:hypothetical protein PV433_17835 [Paenibacillus sp. GYB004]|uniref:hypothetical protein n=1 Tax=Paenibacillus sp. GYB004 TaxID=2994393 RepID=UPI002F968CAC
MIYCGMKEVVITPSPGSVMPGYFKERRLTALKDDLYVKALAIESDGAVVVFVVIDALFILSREVELIRERIRRTVNIPPERILVSATHTHTGPPIWPGLDDAYLARLAEQAADTAIDAYRNRRPARIGFGSGSENEIAFNRRFWMADGTVRTNPGFVHPETVRPTGPVDPEVLVVRIDDEHGQPIGVLTNFACHPDTVGGTEACADYPGELSRTLKQLLGRDVVSLFIQGASGNINHCDYTKPKAVAPDHYRKMGRILAGEVMKVREKIRLSEDYDESVPIEAVNSLFSVELRKPTALEVEKARDSLASPTATEMERHLAVRLLQVLDNPESMARMEVQVVRIGQLVVIGLPGEIFSEFGLQLKRESGFKHTIINTLCNGTNTGYVCTREAYDQGGYEPTLRNLSRNTPETGELFVQQVQKLLLKLA